MITVGIIGGSGLDKPNILKHVKEIDASTEYGKPSSTISVGEIKGVKAALLARHGSNHSINPTNVNYRANITALKELGVTHILAASACGSLREHIPPGRLVFPDQFIDLTKHRNPTFFDKGRVAHVPMFEPFCPKLRKLLSETAQKLEIDFVENGTVLTIEGPRFSTKAESILWRQMGADIINMTTVPECVLAREAGMCYQVTAMPTDFDAWHSTEEAVNIGTVLKAMKQNAEKVTQLFLETIPKISHTQCHCMEAINSSVI